MATALLVLASLGSAAGPCRAAPSHSPEETLLSGIEGARRAPRPLRRDTTLDATADLYAAALLERGELSHAGPGGERVADRACRQGCTDAILGEILGAGPGAQDVVEAWLESQEHRGVIMDRRWTDVGAGAAGDAEVLVCVVLFAARSVEDLRIVEAEVPHLKGRISADAAEPLLLVDLESPTAASWSRETGEFAFPFDPSWIEDRYVRVGYVAADGMIRVTNVLRRGTRLRRAAS